MTALLVTMLLGAPPVGSGWAYSYNALPQRVSATAQGRRIDVSPREAFLRISADVRVQELDGEAPKKMSVVVHQAPLSWRKKPWEATADYGELSLRTGLDVEEEGVEESIRPFRTMLTPLAKRAPPPPADAPCSREALDAVVTAAKSFIKIIMQDGEFTDAQATCLKGSRPQKYSVSFLYKSYSGSNTIDFPFVGTAWWEKDAWIPSLSVKADFATAPEGSRLKIKARGTVQLVIGLKRK